MTGENPTRWLAALLGVFVCAFPLPAGADTTRPPNVDIPRVEQAPAFTYLLDRLTDHRLAAIFNNHILRSKWNWQFTRTLSLCLIFQYTAVLANPELTALETTKNFNADVLVTYLLHPGTAL